MDIIKGKPPTHQPYLYFSQQQQTHNMLAQSGKLSENKVAPHPSGSQEKFQSCSSLRSSSVYGGQNCYVIAQIENKKMEEAGRQFVKLLKVSKAIQLRIK